MFQNREVRACIFQHDLGALGPAGGPAGGPNSVVFLSSPSGYNSSHQLHQLLDAKDQQAWPRLAPSVDSHSCGGLTKGNRRRRTNRRNQSIPSKTIKSHKLGVSNPSFSRSIHTCTAHHDELLASTLCLPFTKLRTQN